MKGIVLFVLCLLFKAAVGSVVIHTRKQSLMPESNKLQIRLSNNGEPIKIHTKGNVVGLKTEEPIVEINNTKTRSQVPEELSKGEDTNLFSKLELVDETGLPLNNNYGGKPIVDETLKNGKDRMYEHKMNGSFVTDGKGNHELHFEGAMHYDDRRNPDHEQFSFHHIKNKDTGIVSHFQHYFKNKHNQLIGTSNHDVKEEAVEEETPADLSLTNLNRIRVGLGKATEKTPEDHSVAMNPNVIKNLIGFMKKLDQEHLTSSGATETDYEAEKAKFEKLQKSNEDTMQKLESEIGSLNHEITHLKNEKGRHKEEIEALEADEKKLSKAEAETLLNYEKQKEEHINFQLGEIEAEKHEEPNFKMAPDKLVELDHEKADLETAKVEMVKPVENALKQNYEAKIEELDEHIHEEHDKEVIDKLKKEKDKVALAEEQTIEDFEKQIDEELGDAIDEFNNDIHVLTKRDVDDSFIDRLEEITESVKTQDAHLRGELESDEESEYDELEKDIHSMSDEAKANELVSDIHSDHDSLLDDISHEQSSHKVIEHLQSSVDALRGLYDYLYRDVPPHPKMVPKAKTENTTKGTHLFNIFMEFKHDLSLSNGKIENELNFLKRHSRSIQTELADVFSFFELKGQFDDIIAGDEELALHDKKDSMFFEKNKEIIKKHIETYGHDVKKLQQSLDKLLVSHEENFNFIDLLNVKYDSELSENVIEGRNAMLALNKARIIIQTRDEITEELDLMEEALKDMKEQKSIFEEFAEKGLKEHEHEGIVVVNGEVQKDEGEEEEVGLLSNRSGANKEKANLVYAMISTVLVSMIL